MKVKVEFKHVSKAFQIHTKQFEKLLSLFSLRRRKENKVFMAVNDVSFTVYEGETIGIVGLNGSGKSTISNMLSQVIKPTEGEIYIDGQPSLIAISAGLNNNLSGMDNIKLKCMMHGLKDDEIERVTPDIIDFADLGDYINQPVKNYSSGMRSRLGFAISIHTDPDILVIDEALSVGDSTFANKCLIKLDEFKKKGKTIFFISHSSSQMKTFCDRVMWINYGEMKEFGSKVEVLNKYGRYTRWFNELAESEKKKYKKEMLQKQYANREIAKKGNENSSIISVGKGIGLFIPLILFGALMLFGY
ncbi:sugar ABC transporter ATP-binding protein [Oceanobacillus arenosus]|uniref:Sugar ABC transporter ATP-binding protein n=1 Tax=Oceanobacillus arenosus TaxID=1229153 RepID=A0A3D8Q3C9_9BACI|nr:ATP-binding cassette domain-containing protein [Oceanobacillus arenosus]RDW22219.1 sugar ABC transporter ATP-binding protein [Oceanobacillus arenosus]